MSTRGRKPDLKVIEGGLEGQPDVPAHIPREMRDEWRAVADDLIARKLLTEAMFGSLDAYIMAQWNLRLAQKQIDTHGLLVPSGKDGVLKQNPAVSLLGKSQEAVMRLAAELGLTPASRAKTAPKKDKDDDSPTLFDF